MSPFSNNTTAKQSTFQLLKVSFFYIFKQLVPVVQKVDFKIFNAIHWIHVNLYPLDSANWFL